jgi:hypothetical protein
VSEERRFSCFFVVVVWVDDGLAQHLHSLTDERLPTQFGRKDIKEINEEDLLDNFAPRFIRYHWMWG